MRKNQTLTGKRDIDFYRACCRELIRAAEAGTPYLNVRDLVRAAIGSPAPQFYISYTHALRRKPAETGHDRFMAKRQMWADFEASVSAMETRHSIPRREAVQKVLTDLPAPRFYFSEKNGERIFRRSRRRRLRSADASDKAVKPSKNN